MDAIRELEAKIIQYEQTSLMLSLTIDHLEDEMVKTVYIDHLKKRDPMLSNDKLRQIEVKTRLKEMEEYTEAIAEKYSADEAIRYGKAQVDELKRDFIMKFCQHTIPI